MTDNTENSLENLLISNDKQNIDDKIKDFTKLLNDIESLDDKKRSLWKEIYQNAIADRQNSYAMFVTLVRICQTKSPEHAIHGRTIASYIERMSKANDQLLKLADLIASAQQKSDVTDIESIYEQMQNKVSH